MKFIGYAVTFVISTIVTTFALGYALQQLWGWFAVPALHVQPLTIPMALGLAYLFGLFNYRYNQEEEDKKREKRSFGERLFITTSIGLLAPALYLFSGYIIHLFM